jgi:MFS superfamily sulfate permease-like transporter
VLGVPQEDGDFFVFQAYPAGGGLSQTAVNRETGARTQLAGIVTALVALAAVLVLGVLEGVLLAVVVSMLTLIHGVNHPPIEVLGRRPGSGHWRAWTGIPTARLDLDAVPDIDVTALDLLPSFDADLRERSITLWLANPNDRPLDMLRRLPDSDAWERRLFGDLDAAAAHSSSSGDEPRPGRPPR